MYTPKLHAGQPFPRILVKDQDGNEHELSKRSAPENWKLIVVYRGRHCPLCTKYLNHLERYKDRLMKNNVEVVAVSSDSKEQMEDQLQKLEIDFPIYWGLTPNQMQELGLYISHPRSDQETDHAFAEPGIFVVNTQGNLHVVDISNNPFVRPELETLVSGLEWIRNPENNYPIRGTYDYAQ